VAVAVGTGVGAIAGGIAGTAGYFLAKSGACGCELQEWAQGLTPREFAGYLGKSMLIGGVSAGVIAVAPIAAPVLGGVGLGLSAYDIMQNGANACNLIGAAASIAGGFAGASGTARVPVFRTSGGGLLPNMAGGGSLPATSPAISLSTTTVPVNVGQSAGVIARQSWVLSLMIVCSSSSYASP
jgi:hypothetical protein